jgi:nitrogen fixation NifU-like protein
LTADLKDLYQDSILDHCRKPRNFGKLGRSNRQAQGLNPLCGDAMTVFLLVEGGIIREISFVGNGCAISMASASMMTESLKGKTEAEANAAFELFDQLLAGSPGSPPDLAGMGALVVFSTLREYPVRAKCAALPWRSLRAALEQRQDTVSTE